MGIVFLQLALTGLLGGAVAPAGTAPAPLPLASTYDQATCASIHGAGADDWDSAAIGEDSPAPDLVEEVCSLAVLPGPRLADCNDPLASRWFGEMIGSCDMPRYNGAPKPGLRAGHSEGRRARLLVELACGESPQPLSAPPEPRSASPALVSAAPSLIVPTAFVLLSASPARPLRSVPRDTLLRPPRA